ncbi:unnamed protein product, partial [Nesidiocoris tenuis]
MSTSIRDCSRALKNVQERSTMVNNGQDCSRPSKIQERSKMFLHNARKVSKRCWWMVFALNPNN